MQGMIVRGPGFNSHCWIWKSEAVGFFLFSHDSVEFHTMFRHLGKTQMANEVNRPNITLAYIRKHTGDPPWLSNPEQTSPEVKKSGVSVAPQKGLVSSKNFQKVLGVMHNLT